MNTPVRVGGEFLVNTTTSASQFAPTVGALSDGRFIVAWQDGSQTGEDIFFLAIRAQVFNADGTMAGGEFLVNTTTWGSQFAPTVSGLSDGRFVVAWQDTSSNFGDIRAQVFNVDGTMAGEEFAVNTTTVGWQTQPTITELSDGRFVVAWTDGSQGETSREDIRAQVFNLNGTKVGDEFLVNTTLQHAQWKPTVTALSDGRFVVAWQDASSNYGDIRAQVFNTDGSKAGNEFLVNTTTWLYQGEPAIAALRGGGFVVAWESGSSSAGDPSGLAIQAQVFNADGTKAGDEFLVNTTTQNSQSLPTVTALSDGRFVVAWTDESHTGGDIRAQVFNSNGTRVGVEYLVNSFVVGQQTYPSITATSDGGFVVAWTDYSETGSDTSHGSIRAQIFGPWIGEPVNEPPVIQSAIPALRMVAGTPEATVALAVLNTNLRSAFSDPDGDTLRFSFDGLPPGLSGTAGGRIRGQLPTEPGDYVVTVTVDDLRGGTASQTFTWSVAPLAYPDADAALTSDAFLQTMARFASAAYAVAPSATVASATAPSPDNADDYVWVDNTFAALTFDDLPGLSEQGSAFRRFGLEGGRYYADNAAALVVRSDDTLVVSFRGTDDARDAVHWGFQNVHFGKFAPLMDALRAHVADSQSSEQPISRIVLTGHSLGAAMVQFAYADLLGDFPGVALEGITFASPGTLGPTGIPANPNIVNFINQFDLIRAPQYVGQLWGRTYQLNNIEGLVDSHSMAAYSAVVEALAAEGVSLADIQARYFAIPEWAEDWFGLDARQLRISVPLDRIGDRFIAGAGPDVVIAGLAEMTATALDAAAGQIPKLSTFHGIYSKVRDAAQVFREPSVLSVADLAASLAGDSANTAVKKLALLYEVPRTLFDIIDSYSRSDIIVGGARGDFLNGLGGHDEIFGGTGNDTLVGLQGIDFLYGGAAHDLLDGRDGVMVGRNRNSDVLDGGIGNDTYIVDSRFDRIIENVDSGHDKVIADGVDWKLGDHLEDLELIDSVTLAGSSSGIGNELNNVIIGGNRNNSLEGRGGNDTISGRAGVDSMYGGQGSDSFIVKSGYAMLGDVIDGGSGKDTIIIQGTAGFAGSTIASIEALEFLLPPARETSTAVFRSDQFGGDAIDSKVAIAGSSATDVLVIQMQGTQFDARFFRFSNWEADDRFEVRGSGSDEIIHGSSQHDVLYGRGGADEIWGGAGADSLDGAAGSDFLVGGSGNDTISGGRGHDTLVGGAGLDDLTGGGGDDVFQFQHVIDLRVADFAQMDVIRDFEQGKDKIQLDFDASDVLLGFERFRFIGLDIFSASDGGEIAYRQFDLSGTANDHTVIYLNTDGDAAAEGAIRLDGLFVLRVEDFIL